MNAHRVKQGWFLGPVAVLALNPCRSTSGPLSCIKLIEAKWSIFASLNLAIIGSDNGLLSTLRHQDFIWNMLTYWPLRSTWWRHQMETFSVLLALCAGNSTVSGEFPSQRPVTRSFDVFFDLRLDKRLSKQSWGWWFETPSWEIAFENVKWKMATILPSIMTSMC